MQQTCYQGVMVSCQPSQVDYKVIVNNPAVDRLKGEGRREEGGGGVWMWRAHHIHQADLNERSEGSMVAITGSPVSLTHDNCPYFCVCSGDFSRQTFTQLSHLSIKQVVISGEMKFLRKVAVNLSTARFQKRMLNIEGGGKRKMMVKPDETERCKRTITDGQVK